jgi:hypothetical protein
MKLRDRYRRLSFWSKFGFWGAIASLVGVPLGLISLVPWRASAPYPTVRQTERQPHFIFYVNKMRVGDEGTNYITFPFPTTEPAQLVISVLNDGNWPAEQVKVMVKFPPPPGFRIKSAERWVSGQIARREGETLETQRDVVAYRVEAQEQIINCQDAFTCPPIVLAFVGGMNQLQIAVSAKNMPYVFKVVAVHYKMGIDKPYLGY